MAYDGWFSFAGTEIANTVRTRAYLDAMMPGITVEDTCTGDCSCDHLPELLGDAPYRTPFLDAAPWIDPDHPESYDFLGLYVTGVTGLTDDTVTYQRGDRLGDGGWVSNKRRDMREVKIDGSLLALSDEGAHYGQTWLKAVLDGGCNDSSCGTSDQLCFLTACVDPSGFAGRQVHWANWKGFDREEANGAYWSNRTLRLPTATSWLKLEASDPDSCGPYEWEFVVDFTHHGGTVYLLITHGDGWVERRPIHDGNDLITVSSNSPTLFISVEPKVDTSAKNSAQWTTPVPSDAALAAQWTSGPGGLINDAHWGSVIAGMIADVSIEFRRIKLVHRTLSSDEDCKQDLLRYIRSTVRLDGPTFGEIRHFKSGGSTTSVSFTLLSESPYIYGEIEEVVSGPLPGLMPQRTGIDVLAEKMPATIGECDTTAKERAFVYDPQRPTLDLPPISAPVRDTLRDSVVSRNRTQYGVLIPDWMISSWLSSVPILSITAGGSDVRFIGVRFFPVPLDTTLLPDVDPCSACGSFEIAYIPKGTTFTVDATVERGVVSQGGWLDAPGNHLLSGAGGKGPVRWPALACGSAYLMVIDSYGQSVEDVSLSLAVRE